MMLGQHRPVGFRAEAANPAIPGFLTSFGSPAYGRLIETNAKKGTAKARYLGACVRCGGAGGADKWHHTGWSCFECGGSGQGPERTMNLYSPEAYARLEAIRAKRAAAAKAKADAAEEARREPYLAWLEKNAHVVEQVGKYAPKELADRVSADCGRYVIPPEWLLDVSIEAALRAGLRADVKAASEHVGTVGKRVEMKLSCEKLLGPYGGQPGTGFGSFYIGLMRDEAGNRIVYKGGSAPLGTGESATFKLTIKEHGDRDGEKQTVIARPKLLSNIVRDDGSIVVEIEKEVS